MSINSSIKRLFFGKKSAQAFFRKIFDLSIEGMNIGTGGGEISRTGEAFVIRHCLGGVKDPVVFDVGAQGGDYSREVISVAGEAPVFAFEPSSRDFAKLKEILGDKIKLQQVALSDTVGRVTLYANGANGLSSLYQVGTETNGGQKEEVVTDTIDNFCQKQNISKIDLLKLDVEGHELACLKGAHRMLPKIKNIQFEMSSRSRDAGTYFKDIFDYLADYRIYRILKDGLFEIESPDKLSELLFTTNYLAKRK